MSLPKTQWKNLHTLKGGMSWNLLHGKQTGLFIMWQSWPPVIYLQVSLAVYLPNLLSCYQRVDLSLICQIETVCQIFNMIQHQKPAHDAPFSPALVVWQVGHCSSYLTTFQGQASCYTAPIPAPQWFPSCTRFIQNQSFQCSTFIRVWIQPQGLQYTLWPHSLSPIIFF